MKPQTLTLTVAIPTYNRNDTLHKNLAQLLPQLTSECKLVILDNKSDRPVVETLQNILDEYPALQVEIIRNRQNIGGAANVARCFELCDTEWLWVLSDDDTVKPDAIETVLKEIAIHPDSVYITFSSDNHYRTEPIATVGLNEFVAKLDYFGSALFISTGVYRSSALQGKLKFAYHYLYTASPHLVLLLMALGEDGKCQLLTEQIVTYERPSIEQRWSYVNITPGLMTLLELPLPTHVQKTLAEKIRVSQPSPRYNAQLFLHAAIETRNERNILYLYDQTCSRSNYFHRNMLTRLQAAAYRTLIAYPQVGEKLMAFYYDRIKGRSDVKYANNDFTRL